MVYVTGSPFRPTTRARKPTEKGVSTTEGTSVFDLEAGDRERAARKAARAAAKTTAAQEADDMAGQVTAADLQGMTAEEITAAYNSGDLNAAIGWAPADVKVVDRARKGGKLTSEDLKVLARLEQHQLIVQAWEAGNIKEPETTAGAADTETEA